MELNYMSHLKKNIWKWSFKMFIKKIETYIKKKQGIHLSVIYT